MKTLKLSVLVAVCLFTFMSGYSQLNKISSGVTIKDMIVYEVEIQDPTKINCEYLTANNISEFKVFDYQEEIAMRYFNFAETQILGKEMKDIVQKNTIYFFTSAGPINVKDLKKLITEEEQYVTEYDETGEPKLDANGNPISKTIPGGIIPVKNWKKIRFYEEWRINRLNGMMEKSQLGYVFFGDKTIDGEKKSNVELFGIAKDKASFEKIKMYQPY